MILRHSVMAGTSIDRAAKEMVELAQAHGEVAADFNGVDLTADKDTLPESIVSGYHAKLEENRIAYEASPEGIAAKKANGEEISRLQRLTDGLLVRLETLDFGDDAAVLTWIEEFQGPSDHVRVDSRREAVLAKFLEKGFVESANTGEAFAENDRENYFRYIVGQALNCLSTVGAIHHVVNKFIGLWRKKFLGDEVAS